MTTIFDQNLTNKLKEQVKGFDAMSLKQQQNTAMLLLLNSTSNRYEHRTYPGCFYIPATELEKMFGRTNFVPLMKSLSPVLISREKSYSDKKRTTYAYRITDDGYRLINEYLMVTGQVPSVLCKLNTNEKVIKVKKAPQNGIESKNIKGHTVQGRPKISSSQTVNIEALKRLETRLSTDALKAENKHKIDALKNEYGSEYKEKIEKMLSQVQCTLRLANNTVVPGALILTYTQAVSGRLYGRGFHLQNIKKEVRNAALEGMYDYDIENCHFALIEQMAGKADYEAKTIRNYLKYKQAIREEIARDVGITVTQAKKCLLAMVYGAVSSTYYTNAIPKKIGPGRAGKLIKNKLYKALKRDTDQAKDAILKNTEIKSGMYINAMDKGISIEEEDKKVLAHLLQGMEAKILSVVLKEHSENIALLQHDGWVTKEPIDRSLIEEMVFKVTGMKVEISEAIIGMETVKYESKKAA